MLTFFENYFPLGSFPCVSYLFQVSIQKSLKGNIGFQDSKQPPFTPGALELYFLHSTNCSVYTSSLHLGLFTATCLFMLNLQRNFLFTCCSVRNTDTHSKINLHITFYLQYQESPGQHGGTILCCHQRMCDETYELGLFPAAQSWSLKKEASSRGSIAV